MAKLDPSQQASRALHRFAQRPPWRERLEALLLHLLDPVAAALDREAEEILDLLVAENLVHILESAAIEILLDRQFEQPPHRLLDDFLRKRGWKLGAMGRTYLQAVAETPPSCYEVLEAVPGSHLVVQDLFDPMAEPVRVRERLGSCFLFRWDRIGARLVEVHQQRMFSGALLPFPASDGDHEELDELIDMLAEDIEKLVHEKIDEALEEEMLRMLPEDMRGAEGREMREALLTTVLFRGELLSTLATAWATFTVRKLLSPMPKLVNRDGDPLLFGAACFAMEAAQARRWTEALDAAPDMERFQDKPPGWHWVSEPETSRDGEGGLALDSMATEGGTILASLLMEGDSLSLQVNSEARMDKARARLTALLPDLGEPRDETWDEVGELSGTATDHAEASGSESPAPDTEETLPPEVKERLEQDFLTAHYLKTLDEPLPMLGGRTPRECAADPEAREDVIRWLKLVENGEARRTAGTGKTPFDTSRLWHELGLSDQMSPL